MWSGDGVPRSINWKLEANLVVDPTLEISHEAFLAGP
jgi:hypothetical protein